MERRLAACTDLERRLAQCLGTDLEVSLMWAAYVLAIFLYQVVLFTAVGFGFSCFCFKGTRNWNMRLVWAPYFGMTVLTVLSADLMYGWLPGRLASWVTVIVCAALSLFCTIYCSKKSLPISLSQSRLVWKPLIPALVAGILFLSPLTLSNNRGFFALNGGDFGSYGGWGDYFADKTLIGGKEDAPVNYTKSCFVYLQHLFQKPGTGWRMGNVSYFVLIKDTSPADFYTSYECSIALNYFVLILAIFAFCRHVLRVRPRESLAVAWGYILCNTVTWLGMAHFLGNLIGLVLVVGAQTLLANLLRRHSTPQIVMLSTAFGALLLQYPELLPYAIAIIGPIILFSQGWRWPSLLRYLRLSLLSLAGGCITVFPFVFFAFNWLLPMFSASSSGDSVGIYNWAYIPQLFGLVDYDYVLTNEAYANAFPVTISCTVAAGILTLFSLRRGASFRPTLGLVIGIGIILLGSLKFVVTHNLFFLFRTYVTVSTFVFLLPMIAATRSFYAMRKKYATPKPVRTLLSWFLVVVAVVFLSLLIFVRWSMIKRVQKGTPHARVFGKRILKIADILKDEIAQRHADYALVDYHGTGTIQASWEWLLQNVPTIFPVNGQGCTPFRTDFLKDARVLILDEGYPRILTISGADTQTQPVSHFASYSIFDSAQCDMIIPFSNSWLYGSTTPNLTLMGTPANILLWSRKSRPATVKVRLVAPTRKCSVRISVNNHELVCIQLAPSEPPGQLTEKEFSFNVNKGLNYFTFIPEIDPLERVERASFIHAVRAKGVAAGRDAIELADFAEHGATPVDPRNLGLYQKWNLLRPPMYQRGFVPYVIMESMKVHLH